MPKEILVATKALNVGETKPHKSLVSEAGAPLNVVKCKIDGSVYADSLDAAGLDIATVKDIQKHDTKYLENIQKEAITAAAEILNNQKDIDQVVFIAPYGADKLTNNTSRVEMVVDRTKKFTNIQTHEAIYRPNISTNVVNKFQKNGDALKTELKDLLQDRLANN